MKKLTALLLAAAMLLGLTACSLNFLFNSSPASNAGDDTEASPPSIGQDGPDASPEPEAVPPNEPDAEDGVPSESPSVPLPDPDKGDGDISDPPASVDTYAIHISHSDVTLKEGETFRLSVSDSNGNRPSACTFTSDNPEIASVDETGGQVTAVAPGIAYITAHAEFPSETKNLKCIVRCRWEAADSQPASGDAQTPSQPSSGEAQASSKPSLDSFFSTLQGKYDSLDGLMVLDGELLDTYYPGLRSVASVEEVLIQESMISISNMAVGLVKLSSDATMDDIAAVTSALQSRLNDQANGGAFYPQSCEIWGQGVTASAGNCVGMFVYPDDAQSMANLFVATYGS